MDIIIAGAGQVGRTVACELDEEHSVCVIDRDSDPLDEIPYRIDAVQGDAHSMETLKDAGIESADMLVTCTSDDQANILICSTARTLSDAFMFARVSDPGYQETWQFSKKAFGVDWMVGRAQLCAERIVRVVGFQSRRESARDVEYFVDGRVEMAEFDVEEGSEIAEKTVRSADQYPGLTFAALFRNSKMVIPDGETRIRTGDRIVVIGEPGTVKSFGIDINPSGNSSSVNDIVIFGGGTIGYQTAAKLEKRGLRPRLVEQDADRARYLSEQLHDTLVFEGDATSRALWNEERLDKADMHVVCLRPDERSMMTGLMGKEASIDRVLSIVHEEQNLPVFEHSQIDMLVHPREVVAEEIIQFTQERHAEKISGVEHHSGDVFEVKVDPNSDLCGLTVQETRSHLPDPMVYGAIYRNERFVRPRGGTMIKAGDHIVLLAGADVAEDIAAKF